MKKVLLYLSILLLSTPMMAQRVLEDNFNRLRVHYSTPEIRVIDGDYLQLSAGDYVAGGEVGAPMLPMSNSLLTVPFCEGMTVEVTNAVFDTLSLPTGRVMPLQPSRSKSDMSEPRMIVNEEVYATDAFFSRPLASVQALGIGRDRNYALLTWSPVSVNPVSGEMIVCRSADVTVRYEESDASATMKYLDRYYTPAFSLGTTLNSLFSTKDVRATAPVRMVIMTPASLQCGALNEFAEWKRQQGMLVDMLVVETNTASSIAAQLQELYDNASDAAPAPTYLVLVGDHAQLRAFNSDLSSSTVNVLQNYASLSPDHITDLYFTTWTAGDKLPDCYQGRFSATDTVTLGNMINKILYYERYQFEDDNYLSRATLVAGVDNRYNTDYYDNAWRCADPTMDYVAYYYVNADNGYTDVRYYKNDANYAPTGVTVTGSSQASNAATTLRNLYNSGMGWINYSAHGDWNEWSIPVFRVSHVNSMTNNNKPSFMIGNCCLSNKFDEATCFGEALLRKGNNAGASAYIGATNSTFWNEDFYWSVGMRSNISHTMTPYYDVNRMGMYDRLFHTHNEVLSKQVHTAGQILMAGNMSVNRASGSSQWATAVNEYYWEIYELMGDPSMLPWMGVASDLTVASVYNTGSVVNITTVPGAYVALVVDSTYEWAASAFADESGVVSLPLPAVDLNSCLISVTAQGYKPYLQPYSSHNVGLRDVVDGGNITVSPNPASVATEVTAPGLYRVSLLNVMGQTLQTLSASADRCAVSLGSLPAGLYLLRIESASGTAVRKVIKN